MRKILSVSAVCAAAGGVTPKTLRRWVRNGDFPEPVQVSPGRIGWYSDEVSTWQEERPRGFLAPICGEAA